MLKICQRSIYIPNKSLISCILLKDVASSFKFARVCQNNLARHFASKITEDSKLECIYYGPLTPQIRAVKVFSLCSSLAGLVAQPIIIREASTIGSTPLLIAMCSVVGFFTFITPILLHLITKKYVTEVHYDPRTSTYTTTTISFFLVPKKLDFKVEDVTVSDLPGMFTTMFAKGKPLFLEARHFKDPLHYAKIMGYDKPMDFKLGNVENEQQNHK
ncbi:transmembrane protein 70 homolog, mitochondrial [Epargyreus clarus]|uniref:transmembrane protein 70 homolog, mitochondrial n=1 Tax=Epargyreus clarus TaxID=520877 RepID=UPI003C308607